MTSHSRCSAGLRARSGRGAPRSAPHVAVRRLAKPRSEDVGALSCRPPAPEGKLGTRAQLRACFGVRLKRARGSPDSPGGAERPPQSRRERHRGARRPRPRRRMARARRLRRPGASGDPRSGLRARVCFAAGLQTRLAQRPAPKYMSRRDVSRDRAVGDGRLSAPPTWGVVWRPALRRNRQLRGALSRGPRYWTSASTKASLAAIAAASPAGEPLLRIEKISSRPSLARA